MKSRKEIFCKAVVAILILVLTTFVVIQNYKISKLQRRINNLEDSMEEVEGNIESVRMDLEEIRIKTEE